MLQMPRGFRCWIAQIIPKILRRRLRRYPFPDRMTLFITDHCNMRCPHCFIRRDDLKSTSEMSTEQYQMFFAKICGRVSHINVTGGEPTIRDDMADILLAASREGRIDSATVFTNGLLKDRLMATITRVLAESNLRIAVQISLDGGEKYHDANRGVPGAYRNALDCMKFLGELRAQSPNRLGRLVAGTAISVQNMEQLPEVISVVRSMGFLHAFAFVRSSQYGVFGLTNNNLISGFTPRQFADYLDAADRKEVLRIIHRELWDQDRNSLFQSTNRVTLEAINESLVLNRPLAPCVAGRGDIVVLPDGAVSRCEMLRSFAHLNDFKWDLGALLTSKTAEQHFTQTRGCWCVHDCAIGMGIMYDRNLLRRLFYCV